MVDWKEGVLKDIDRVRAFVENRKAETAYAILIDEGGYFRKQEPPQGSRWVDWGPSPSRSSKVWALVTCVRSSDQSG